MQRSFVSSFLQLLFYMRPFRRMYLSATLYSFLHKLLNLMPEILLGITVNTVVAREQSWLANLGFYETKTQLFILGILTMVAHGFESLFEYLFSIQWSSLSQLVQHNFRMQAFDHVQKSTIFSLSNQKMGNLLSVLNDDINQLERFLEGGLDRIIEVIGMSLFVGSIFFFLAPQIAFFVVIPIPMIVYGTFRLKQKISPYYFKVREKAGFMGSFLANSLLRLLTTKSFVAEKLEKEKLEQASIAYREANLHAIKWGALLVPGIRFAILSGILITLVYGGRLALDNKLDVGVYSILIVLTQRLLSPFTDLAETMIDFQRVMASTGRLLDILELPLENSPNNIVSIQGGITFTNVSFSYPNQPPILENISFQINPGEHVAFVGTKGAGKSTLLHLLLGFYATTTGQILFDNQDIRHIALSVLRRQLGFVNQDPLLFEGTIGENISYGYPEATHEQIVEAAKNAAAHEFIMQLSHGYNTMVEERGQYLSGGQRQTLAIARAIVRHPAILILDEATSAVDNETELSIQKALANIRKGRTVITVTHRLSLAKQANRIFVLQKSTIVEEGTHEELLQHEDVYANLWKLHNGELIPQGASLASSQSV